MYNPYQDNDCRHQTVSRDPGFGVIQNLFIKIS